MQRDLKIAQNYLDELLADISFKILKVEEYDEYAQIGDIYGQGCNYPTKKGVSGFQVDFDIVFQTEEYHIVFQTEDRNDNMRAYSSCGMSTASSFGCDADQSTIIMNDHDYSREAAEVISTLKSIAEIFCERYFERNYVEED